MSDSDSDSDHAPQPPVTPPALPRISDRAALEAALAGAAGLLLGRVLLGRGAGLLAGSAAIAARLVSDAMKQKPEPGTQPADTNPVASPASGPMAERAPMFVGSPAESLPTPEDYNTKPTLTENPAEFTTEPSHVSLPVPSLHPDALESPPVPELEPFTPTPETSISESARNNAALQDRETNVHVIFNDAASSASKEWPAPVTTPDGGTGAPVPTETSQAAGSANEGPDGPLQIDSSQFAGLFRESGTFQPGIGSPTSLPFQENPPTDADPEAAPLPGFSSKEPAAAFDAPLPAFPGVSEPAAPTPAAFTPATSHEGDPPSHKLPNASDLPPFPDITSPGSLPDPDDIWKMAAEESTPVPEATAPPETRPFPDSSLTSFPVNGTTPEPLPENPFTALIAAYQKQESTTPVAPSQPQDTAAAPLPDFLTPDLSPTAPTPQSPLLSEPEPEPKREPQPETAQRPATEQQPEHASANEPEPASFSKVASPPEDPSASVPDESVTFQEEPFVPASSNPVVSAGPATTSPNPWNPSPGLSPGGLSTGSTSNPLPAAAFTPFPTAEAGHAAAAASASPSVHTDGLPTISLRATPVFPSTPKAPVESSFPSLPIAAAETLPPPASFAPPVSAVPGGAPGPLIVPALEKPAPVEVPPEAVPAVPRRRAVLAWVFLVLLAGLIALFYWNETQKQKSPQKTTSPGIPTAPIQPGPAATTPSPAPPTPPTPPTPPAPPKPGATPAPAPAPQSTPSPPSTPASTNPPTSSSAPSPGAPPSPPTGRVPTPVEPVAAVMPVLPAVIPGTRPTAPSEPVVFAEPLPGVPQEFPAGSPEAKSREALEKLLSAENLKDIAPLVHSPAQASRQALTYFPDGKFRPSTWRRILFDAAEQLPQTGYKARLFRVVTQESPLGFPVAVEDTKEGPRVDFEAFIQCRDRLLDQFMTKRSSLPGKFLVVLRRGHYFGDELKQDDLNRLLCLEVASPNPGATKYSVFIPKDTDLGRLALRKFTWDKIYTPIVELTHNDRYISISSLVQDTWQRARR